MKGIDRNDVAKRARCERQGLGVRNDIDRLARNDVNTGKLGTVVFEIASSRSDF